MFNLVGGPGLVVLATLSLWHNEGRFDYNQAARQTSPLESLEQADPQQTSSFTGSLQDRRIEGKYVTEFAPFYSVTGDTEIYSWRKSTDEDGNVSWSEGWRPNLQQNSRNRGLEKTLDDVGLQLKELKLGDLEIRTHDIHFADDSVEIPPSDLTLSDLGQRLRLQPEGDYFYVRKGLRSDTQLGDERIRYTGIPAGRIATYFGEISGSVGTARRHEVKSGIVSGLISDDGILHHLVNGRREVALDTIKSHQRKLKWMVRLIGTAATIFGFFLFFSRFLHFLIAIPVVGQLVKSGAFLVSAVLGGSLSILTIVSSLLFHRPFTVLLPLVGVAAVVILFIRKSKKAKGGAQRVIESQVAPQGVEQLGAVGLSPGGAADPKQGRVFCDLVRLALADGLLDDRERDFLFQWASARGLGEEEIGDLWEEAKKEPGKAPDAIGSHEFPFLVSLAMIDGHMSTKEYRHLISTGEKLGMDRDQINSVISDVQMGKFLAPSAPKAA